VTLGRAPWEKPRSTAGTPGSWPARASCSAPTLRLRGRPIRRRVADHDAPAHDITRMDFADQQRVLADCVVAQCHGDLDPTADAHAIRQHDLRTQPRHGFARQSGRRPARPRRGRRTGLHRHLHPAALKRRSTETWLSPISLPFMADRRLSVRDPCVIYGPGTGCHAPA
jgi:hypothetical protein